MFQNGSKEVNIKARGRAISRAVDAALIVTGRMVPEAKVDQVSIGTEQVQGEGDSTNSVSSILIRLSMYAAAAHSVESAIHQA